MVWDHSHDHIYWYYNTIDHSCNQLHLNPNYEFEQVNPDGTKEMIAVYYEDGMNRVGTPETIRARLTRCV